MLSAAKKDIGGRTKRKCLMPLYAFELLDIARNGIINNCPNSKILTKSRLEINLRFFILIKTLAKRKNDDKKPKIFIKVIFKENQFNKYFPRDQSSDSEPIHFPL